MQLVDKHKKASSLPEDMHIVLKTAVKTALKL